MIKVAENPRGVVLRNGLRLLPLGQEHGEGLRRLRNKPTVRCWFTNSAEVSSSQQLEWLTAYLGRSNDLMWVAVDPCGEVVAAASLYDIDLSTGTAEFGRLMVDPDRRDYRGTGRILTQHLLGEALQIGLRRVQLLVKEDNDRAITIYRELGFARPEPVGDQVRLTWYPPTTGETVARSGSRAPWWGKIGAKIALSRLPLDYRFWRRMNIFRHGQMDDVEYVRGTFDRHISRAGLQGQLSGKVIMELGPGDSVGTAVLAAANGARAILLDAGDFASSDVEIYRRLASALRLSGLNPPDLSGASNVADVLRACDTKYLRRGLVDLGCLPTGSVDLIFSQAVLEHVRVDEFADFTRQCRRVLRDSGVCSHSVDLKDHLGGGLNNLRFSRSTWESDFFATSGFYTNRLRFREMMELFSENGFETQVLAISRWDHLPISRNKLDEQFSRISDEELCVSEFEVLLHPTSKPMV